MSIEFNENTLGCWFIGMDGMDWMCGVTRIDAEHFAFKCRIRYYDHPTEAWDGKDHRSWTSGTAKMSREEMIRNMARFAAEILKLEGGTLHTCIRALDETYDDFMARFVKMPFVHAKTVSEQEYVEKYGGTPPRPKP